MQQQQHHGPYLKSNNFLPFPAPPTLHAILGGKSGAYLDIQSICVNFLADPLSVQVALL